MYPIGTLATDTDGVGATFPLGRPEVFLSGTD